jgi:SAM-dependent methyltransferase
MTSTAGARDAFEALAPRFDVLFSPVANPLVGILRERVHRALQRHFSVGATLLELGCGTGEDTLPLVTRGYHTVSCDPADAMIAEARAKVGAAGKGGAVRFVRGGAATVADAWPELGLTVDGAFSNFAPLNCELSLAPLRLLLERALPRGGRFLATVLPRWCPLEIVLCLGRGDVRTAFRRFSRQPVADVDGVRFPMRYYGAGDFDRALGGGFRRIETRSLGLFLPPVSFGPAFARVPGLLAALSALDDRVSGAPGLRRMGDLVLLVYERL